MGGKKIQSEGFKIKAQERAQERAQTRNAHKYETAKSHGLFISEA